MKIKYPPFKFQPVVYIVLAMLLVSCKKDKVAPSGVTLGLYEFSYQVNKRIFIPISGVGDKTDSIYYSVFDTGSPGMTIDASGLIPASMITASGIQFTGDSVVVNGITITSKTSKVVYGDQTGSTTEYGNLAYADIKVGDSNGSIAIKRVPFFLYYKVVDEKGNRLGAHTSDVFGVGPGMGFADSRIQSPLKLYNFGSSFTNGFKLATLNPSLFSDQGTYVGGLLTIGLTQNDLSNSGFIMHPLSFNSTEGYSPNIPATITYNGKTVANAMVLFDTGTPSTTVIEDKTAVNSLGALPANSLVTVTTNKGFVYQYTTSNTANLTAIQNPNITGDFRTVFSLDFFIKNEYLTDYTNHYIGLKNN